MSCPSVIVADDHTVFAEALGHLLRDSYQILATVGDGRALLASAERLRPDLVVVDFAMPLLNGVEATRRLRRLLPKVKIVFLSMHRDTAYVVQAMRAGATGYVLKTSPADEVLRALRHVWDGGVYLDPQFPPELRQILPRLRGRHSARPPGELTAREREVLQLVAEGHPAKEMAYLLHVSTKTIEFHKYNLMKKTMQHSTAGLVRLALRLGLSDVDPPVEKPEESLTKTSSEGT